MSSYDQTFAPHSWETWDATYRRFVRVGVDWEAIDSNPIKAEIKTVYLGGPVWDYKVYVPQKSGKGNWVAGDNIEVQPGDRPILVRAAGVKVGNKILVIDGCTKLRQKRPVFVVIDCVVINKENYVYFLDLLHPVWSEVAKKIEP
jgi:hypothetical protein